jgi:haloacid dehalogenase superfamily, subfamily IA, variant 3 with third motif having DD or ED
MITTIILDIGNVLARFGWKEYLKECGYEEELIHKISKATVWSEAWKNWDRGNMTREEMYELCNKYDSTIDKEVKKFCDDVYTIVQEFEYAEEFVKQMKANGYQVYLLSNFNGGHYLYCKEKFKFIKYVDGGVISYEVNSVKPEPEIYEALLTKYQINPSEAVFLDDLKENLEAAKAFGIQTILVKTQEQAIKELRELGITI